MFPASSAILPSIWRLDLRRLTGAKFGRKLMTATTPYNNHSLVGEALRQLAAGLGPYVVDKMNNAVASGQYAPDDSEALGEISGDIAVTLRIMTVAWNDVFREHLGPVERSLVSEIRETRNRWAHQDAFDDDDLDRALDSVGRLLGAVGARAEAKRIDSAKHRLRLRRYGSPSPQPTGADAPVPEPEAEPVPSEDSDSPQFADHATEADARQSPAPSAEAAEQAAEEARRDVRVREHILQGIDFRRREHYGNAMAEFEQALRIDRERADAWFHRGMTWGLMEEHRRAIEDFNRAIAMAPAYAQAFNCRGYAHFCLGEYRQAVEDLEKADRLSPEDELIQGNLQQARLRFLQQSGSPDRARHGSGPLP